MSFATRKAALASLREFSVESGLREQHEIVAFKTESGETRYCRVLMSRKPRI